MAGSADINGVKRQQSQVHCREQGPKLSRDSPRIVGGAGEGQLHFE